VSVSATAPSRRVGQRPEDLGRGADTDEQPLICAECGREPRDDKNKNSAELIVFCPECAEREFGGDAACAAAHRARRSGQTSDLDGH
jgi:hypothetical protein